MLCANTYLLYSIRDRRSVQPVYEIPYGQYNTFRGDVGELWSYPSERHFAKSYKNGAMYTWQCEVMVNSENILLI